jgi:tRNA threonylcarbamoyladenosine biosynthesis protein TsaB
LKILALDTSSDACSVALWTDDTLLERYETGNQHSGRILSLVQAVLAESGHALTQLDAIAFSRGPGSFTGLRIGAGVTQGLAFGADLPVLPVSSLAALAQGLAADKVLAALDARMNQLYWGAYVRNARGFVELCGEENVLGPAQLPMPEGTGWIGAGNGWDQYAAELAAHFGHRVSGWREQCFPHARFVAQLGIHLYAAGGALPPEQALPVYLRDDVAKKQNLS